MADWSELPTEVLGLFAERLLGIEAEYFVRFAAVCKLWRSAATQVKKRRCFGPWLMSSKLENQDPADTRGIRTCYSLSTCRFFHLALPQLQGRRCWGTNLGWLLTFDLHSDNFLFDPFTLAKISLPSTPLYNDIKVLYAHFPVKFALSLDPSDSNPSPTIMITYRVPTYTGDLCILCFASPGDENWTVMATPSPIDDVVATHSPIDDVIFFKGRFYCISWRGVLVICDMTNDSGPRTIGIADTACGPHGFIFSGIAHSFYLVEISGNLYLINRSYETHREENAYTVYVTRGFDAYKFDFGKKKWGDLCRHLEGHALFLGNNSSCALSHLDYPQFKGDCIYYTDDAFKRYLKTSSDMGIYDYRRGVIIGSFENCSHKPTEFSESILFMPLLN